MRQITSLKTLIRTPLRTFLTLLLLAAATFALFSRAAEYAITTRELDRAASLYRGIASLDNGLPDTSMMKWYSVFSGDKLIEMKSYMMVDGVLINDTYVPQQPLTAEQIDVFASLLQVGSVDTRFMTAGFSEDGFLRLDLKHDPSYNYTNRFIIEGNYSSIYGNNDQSRTGFHLRNSELLAGDPDVIKGITSLIIKHFEQVAITDFHTGGNYGTARRPVYWIFNNPFGIPFRNTLNEGERCLIIGRWEPWHPWQYIYIGDADTMDYTPSFWSLDGVPENYLDLDEFAPVRELIEITNNDLRTFDMVYTSDMPSIPRFANNEMVITDGRSLTNGDEGTANCVVSVQFQRTNRLEIGDTITMSLGGKLLEQNAMTGAVACIPERYAPPGETVELTIVGVYRDVDTQEDRLANAYTGYSANTIFVPLSLLPVEVPDDHMYMPGEYSFIVGNALDNDAFLEAAIPLAEEMGLTLRFNDSGWARVEQNFGLSRQMSLLTAVLFFAAAAAAVLMSLWLFIWRGRGSYAIMRALGATRNKALNALLVPFSFLCIFAIPIGAAAGLIFTSQSVAPILESIAQAAEKYTIDATLPVPTIRICLLLEVAFLTVTAVLFMLRLSRISVLMLLQGSNMRMAKQWQQPELSTQELLAQSKPHSKNDNNATPSSINTQHSNPILTAPGKQYGAFRFVSRSTLRRSRRAFLRATLSLLLTVLMCAAMGMLTVTRQNYFDLYSNTEIKGFLQHAASDVLEDAVRSELLSNVYYYREIPGASGMNRITSPIVDESGFICNETAHARSVIITSDIGRYLTETGNSDCTVSFTDGFHGKLSESYTITECVIGSDIAEELGISLGDTINISNQVAWYSFLINLDMLYPNGPSDERFFSNGKWKSIDNYHSIRTNMLSSISSTFLIAGIVDCEQYNTSVFLPVSQDAEKVLGAKYSVGYSEFVVADFDRMAETEELLASYRARSTRLSAHATLTLDASERENIESMLELLNTLFPYAVVAAVAIGVIAPFLMLLLSAKEAAVMRVLGTTKKRARSMLVLEQAGLCMFGIALAVIGLYIYDAALMLRAGETLLFCGGLYVLGYILASVAASFIVTHRKPLELLQVKE